MNLARELGKRLLALAVVLFLVTLFTSALLNLVPGDPIDTLVPLAPGPEADAAKAELRERLDLDEPFQVQYSNWVKGFVTGDFGNYYRVNSEDPVRDRVESDLPVSLQLMLYAQVLALVVAIPLGVMTAHRAGSKLDRATNTGAFALLSVPSFVLGLVLAYYVGVFLGWLPPSGYRRFSDGIVDHFRYMALPTLTLAAAQIAVYMRLLRSDMVQTLQEDFIQMARSKGISDRRVLWRHALRPSTITLLTVSGLNVGTLIGTALVVERLFSIPGLGQALFEAISERQYVALQSFVAILAILFVLVNFTVDVLYTVIDPRIRHARATS